MFYFALRRLATALPVLLIAVTFCFFVLRLAPGGPFDEERPLPPQIRENIERHYNLHLPLVEQYFLYLGNMFTGDLGPSFSDRTFTVSEKIAQGLPYTLTIGAWVLVISLVFGTITGMLSAFYQNTWVDYLIAPTVLVGLLVPNFLMAPILQVYLALYFDNFLSKVFSFISSSEVTVDLFKVGGWGDGSAQYLALPIFVLATPYLARFSRIMRGSMIETLNSDFIRTARAKGIGKFLIIFRHAVRPALIPVMSYLGPAASYILTGSIIIESIFGLPGIGKFFIDAALNRDYGMVLGTVVFYMMLILVLNLLVDLCYAALDPRVRYR